MSTQAPAYEGLGRPIKGPSALTGDWRRFWHLTYNIARNEFKLKFYGSALGYIWQVMQPLLLFGVLYTFFVVIGKVGDGHKPGEAHYGVQLLGSIVIFGFFNEATSGAVRSVVSRENLVRKIQFPRLAIPLSVVLLSFFNFLLNFTVVLIFALAEGIYPKWSWLEMLPIVALLGVFAAGIAMLLSALFVSFRDIEPIWTVIGQALFYGSPVIIPIETVRQYFVNHPVLLHIYMLNPLAPLLQQFRHAMVNPQTVSAAFVSGGWLALLAPLAIVLAVCVLGFVVFNRSAPYVAENL
ncbi:MAG TPA: ABC transporter permease [Solirubrobacteraceae bacterium]